MLLFSIKGLERVDEFMKGVPVGLAGEWDEVIVVGVGDFDIGFRLGGFLEEGSTVVGRDDFVGCAVEDEEGGFNMGDIFIVIKDVPGEDFDVGDDAEGGEEGALEDDGG